MPNNKERRCYSRTFSEAPIIYAFYNTKNYHGAKMYNASPGGMNLVVNHPLKPGSDVCIKYENQPPGKPSARGFRAEVIWCKEVSKIYPSYYGNYEVGVQYYDPIDI